MRGSQQHIRLPAAPTSPGTARRFVAGQLQAVGAGDLVDVGVLLTSELVTNAVVHAGGTIDLTVDCQDNAVRVGVADHHAGQPVRRTATEQTTSGRGLSLVEALAARWGADHIEGDGKQVWFELEL